MNITSIDYIKELSGILNQNELTKIDISDKETRLIIEKDMVARTLSTTAKKTEYTQSSISVDPVPIVEHSSVKEVIAPIVGVFYISPAPDAEPYVKIGDTVKKGDVLCIIEAMKCMNEITSEHDGTISDICVKNGDLVEFGQVIFKM